MSMARAAEPPGIAAGINQIEGYLLLQTERDAARERARRFTGRLDWLTSAQRAEVERLYVQDQLAVTERNLRTVVRRCEELRAEYQEVYRTLRRRLLLVCLLGAAALSGGLAAALTVR
ncbi:hypothetical protein IGW14_27065 [Streptomyces hygroscopicus subsp. hygroscopicus]|uniref:Cytochrome C oxidase subunit I n=2 Tax=Streptomyces TaxID=1883 RepID=A0ABT9L3W1_9ACTN|nr:MULTISPECIES: hypothetical protein [Streptomyces]MBW8091539.1 hypothetical protein [Streptomyces hygroscopicus subsp. hygroscopicus]MDN3059329.1 hypothetical protein [Streptomyces sp. SRF1]MDP9615357.1 hypothetical protein [Streptomyces demainii]